MLPFANERKLSPEKLLAMASEKKEELFWTGIVNKFKTFSPSMYITKHNFKVNIFVQIRLKTDYPIWISSKMDLFLIKV